MLCRKLGYYWPRGAPARTFGSVSIGPQSCGLRTDSSIVCWSSRLFRSADRTGTSGPELREETPVEDARVHQPAIDVLEREIPGVFAGTGFAEGLCPREPLRRWEMAVWLVRVLDRTDPPQQAAIWFDNVDRAQWWRLHGPGHLPPPNLGASPGRAEAPMWIEQTRCHLQRHCRLSNLK